jgi:hypothetical protein
LGPVNAALGEIPSAVDGTIGSMEDCLITGIEMIVSSTLQSIHVISGGIT